MMASSNAPQPPPHQPSPAIPAAARSKDLPLRPYENRLSRDSAPAYASGVPRRKPAPRASIDGAAAGPSPSSPASTRPSYEDFPQQTSPVEEMPYRPHRGAASPPSYATPQHPDLEPAARSPQHSGTSTRQVSADPARWSATEPVDLSSRAYGGHDSYAESQPFESPILAPLDANGPTARHVSTGSIDSGLRSLGQGPPPPPPPHQHMSDPSIPLAANQRDFSDGVHSTRSASPASSMAADSTMPARKHLSPLPYGNGRHPMSQGSLALENGRPRAHSPLSAYGSPVLARPASVHSGYSPESRPISYVDLLNLPYHQQAPAPASLDNSHLRDAIGNNASLLSHKQTLEMYRANAKKTNDATILYNFAVFLVDTANDPQFASADDENTAPGAPASPNPARDLESPYVDNQTPLAGRGELLREARQILQRLSDRSPFAQYYLADGYASGVFGKGKSDYDRAFPLFVSASKHGHAEAGYRVGLCYELGWGCRKDPAKAVQFYRQSASKNHPGACTRLGLAYQYGDLGLAKREREMLKWLKRAAESADVHHSSGPYELGVLHETGYGADVFKDESYAAQLYTNAADLGHVRAALRMGHAYEHGELNCPRDSGLSVHFYNIAAQRGNEDAMMCLCAWYLVGAEPTLEKDDNEAYEWAKRAADLGLAKAQYAVGYFTEMGIGCRRDPLEANQWYFRAAEQGDERAKHRQQVIQAAASGDPLPPPPGHARGNNAAGERGDKNCIVM